MEWRSILKVCESFHNAVFRENLVGLSGLEPPTSPLSGVRSNHLSYKPVEVLLLVFHQTICVDTAKERFFKVRR